MKYVIALGAAAAMLMTACGGGAATPTAAPTATKATPTQAAPTATATTAPPTATRPTATPVPAPTPTPIPPPTPATGTPKRGGVVKQADEPTVNRSFQIGLRSVTIGPENAYASRLMYQPLLQYDPYDNNKLKGLLAESWQFTDAADGLTLKLAKDARWSDGKLLTAQDVKFMMDNYASPPPGYVALVSALSLKPSVDSTTVVDDKTVRIKLKGADVGFLSNLADPDVVIRPAYRTLEQSATDPVGTGPFVLTGIQPDVRFTFARNSNYWMKDAQGGALPYLDGIENLLITDFNLAYSAITTGRLDALHAKFANAVIGRGEEIAKRMPGSTIQRRYATPSGWGFSNKAPFNNPLFLKAMHIITDRLTILEIFYRGGGVIDATGVMPSSSGSEWALPMKEILSTPGYRYIERQSKQLELDTEKLRVGLTKVYEKDPQDIDLAKSLLRQAGLDPDKGQFPPFTITADPRGVDRAVMLQDQLKRYLGVNIQVEPVDLQTGAQRIVTDGNFIATSAFSFSLGPDPSFTLRYFTTGNGFFKHGYTLTELDDLFNKQRAAVDPAKRREYVWEMQRKIIAGGSPVIPIVVFYDVSGLIREWVKNWEFPTLTVSYAYSHDRAWVER